MNIDLLSKDMYPPLQALSTEELFAFGLSLARSLPHMRVRAPVGDDAVVTLDSKLLRKKGCEVF